MLFDSINRTDLDLRRKLFETIVLSGGTTLSKGLSLSQTPTFHPRQAIDAFVGFGQRVKNELERLAVKGTKIKIFAPPERKYTTWIGGSILAALGTFRKVLPSLPGCARMPVYGRCGLVRRNIRRIRRLFIGRRFKMQFSMELEVQQIPREQNQSVSYQQMSNIYSIPSSISKL